MKKKHVSFSCCYPPEDIMEYLQPRPGTKLIWKMETRDGENVVVLSVGDDEELQKKNR